VGEALPAVGAVFTGVGETSAITSVIPWLVGRTVFELPPEIAALAFLGILCGSSGLVLEFAFVNGHPRLLCGRRPAGSAANKTGTYDRHVPLRVGRGDGARSSPPARLSWPSSAVRPARRAIAVEMEAGRFPWRSASSAPSC
jgi:hypothetical protein